jgi:hypothetical protein
MWAGGFRSAQKFEARDVPQSTDFGGVAHHGFWKLGLARWGSGGRSGSASLRVWMGDENGR